jgi:hypothetical protein
MLKAFYLVDGTKHGRLVTPGSPCPFAQLGAKTTKSHDSEER